MPKRKQSTVWVIMHYEFMFEGRLDCLQFHVSLTLKKAEEYITRHGMMPYSWWQVHPHVVDDDGQEGDEVYYYSHRGTKLKAAPYEQAKAAYERAKKKRQV